MRRIPFIVALFLGIVSVACSERVWDTNDDPLLVSLDRLRESQDRMEKELATRAKILDDMGSSSSPMSQKDRVRSSIDVLLWMLKETERMDDKRPIYTKITLLIDELRNEVDAMT
jgi:hypothetical protein